VVSIKCSSQNYIYLIFRV